MLKVLVSILYINFYIFKQNYYRLIKGSKFQQVRPIWHNYQRVKNEGRILWLTFTTLSDYLWLLRAATQCLQQRAPKALLYLAAAVSDFYIPQGKS